MSLIPWNPFQEIGYLRREVDRVFDRFRHPTEAFRTEFLGPPVDIYETNEHVIATAELPGIESKDDIDVTVTEDTLMLRGQIKRSQVAENENYYHTERYYGTFARTIRLPSRVQPENTEASYKNGILEVKMAKAESERKRTFKPDIH